MAKIKEYKFGGYTIPTDPEVVALRVRTAPFQFTGGDIDYLIPYDEIPLQPTFALPLPNTPLLDQNLYIALSTVDNAGNESDLLFKDGAGAPFMFPFDLIAPPPPGGVLSLQ